MTTTPTDPITDDEPTPDETRAHRSQPAPILLAGVLLVAGIAAAIGIGVAVKGDDPGQNRLAEADRAAGSDNVDLGDDGDSLFIDGEGEEDDGASPGVIAATLIALDVPDSVVERMDSTRALDGTQDATWNGLEATWNYHPDNGLDVVIEQAD